MVSELKISASSNPDRRNLLKNKNKLQSTHNTRLHPKEMNYLPFPISLVWWVNWLVHSNLTLPIWLRG
jgi:hypothetical protein